MSKRATKQPEQAVSKEPVIYVGATLPRGQLNRYTVYAGGVLPEYINNMDDIIKKHIIPVSKLAEYQKNIADKNSIESLEFAKLLKTLQGDK